MSKHVCFLLLDSCALWEAAYLAAGLERFGHIVQTLSLSRAPLRSIGGLTLLPDAGLEDAPEQFDGLALIGGNAWRSESAAAAEPLIRRALACGAVLGAICDAAGFLGTLGLLDGVRHTCNDLTDLRRWAGVWYGGEAWFRPRQAVRDGTLVTANGTAALEFAREFLLALGAAPEADIIGWYAFHKLGCYTAPLPERPPWR